MLDRQWPIPVTCNRHRAVKRLNPGALRLLARFLGLGLICLAPAIAPGNAKADPEFVTAYFYEFKPERCSVSLDGYGASICDAGAITVAANDRNSVNIHLIGKLGQWQLMISNGREFVPQVDAVIIRTVEHATSDYPVPDFYFQRGADGIIQGNCSPIPLTPQTSARCIVKLFDGRSLEVSFKTNNLSPSRNVRREPQ